MKQYKTAIDQANKLLEYGTTKEGEEDEEDDDDEDDDEDDEERASMIEAWKSKIRELLAEIVAESETDASNPAAAVEVIEGEAKSQDVDFAVAHCNWKQIGTKDENFYWDKEVQVIPRLRWVLARVRDDLLIWDYDKEEVVHFITLGSNEFSGVDGTTTYHVIDMPELNAVLYFRGLAKPPTFWGPVPAIFWILNLQALTPRGGCTDAYELSLPLALTAADLCGRTYSYFLENASQLYSNVASIAASKNDSGQWRLALSYRDRRGVSIYKAGNNRLVTLRISYLTYKDTYLMFVFRRSDSNRHIAWAFSCHGRAVIRNCRGCQFGYLRSSTNADNWHRVSSCDGGSRIEKKLCLGRFRTPVSWDLLTSLSSRNHQPPQLVLLEVTVVYHITRAEGEYTPS